MDKKIPLTFDIMISSPLTPINESLPSVYRSAHHNGHQGYIDVQSSDLEGTA